ncbi:MAG: SIR2 family protein [Aquabacterium sp.]
MSRATVVFGNGLGMALDPDYFLLESGLREVWSGSPHFNEQHKRLVASAIPGIVGDAHPSTEVQLDQLQVAIVASEFLREFETNEVKWLAQEASELPEAFKRFLHEVASYFHNHQFPLPIDFVTALAEFTNRTKSHITTLNYDNLLYDGFKGHGVFNGYRGSLLDGFLANGFASTNLDRFYPARHGWYLHLHGSPLFVGNRKIMGEERRFFEPNESSHIVLTHVEHKPLIIERSDILTTYWSYFHDALAESETYILFGYSGADVHLNRALADRVNERTVHVIEWSGSGDQRWSRKFEQVDKCSLP